MAKSKSDTPETKQKPHHALFEYLEKLGLGKYLCSDPDLELSIDLTNDYYRISITSEDPDKILKERICYSTYGGSLRYELSNQNMVELNSPISPRTSFKVHGEELKRSFEEKPPYKKTIRLLLYDTLLALKARKLKKVASYD